MISCFYCEAEAIISESVLPSRLCPLAEAFVYLVPKPTHVLHKSTSKLGQSTVSLHVGDEVMGVACAL